MIDIDRGLRDLAEHVDFPSTPDFSPALTNALASEPVSIQRRSWRRMALVAIAAVVVLALAAVAYPPTRQGIAKFLHLRGVTIERRSSLPTPSSTLASIDSSILGKVVTESQARAAANFKLRIPAQPPGPPTIRLGRADSQPVVSLLYPPSNSLPDPRGTGIGLLLTEFRGDLVPELLGKIVGADTAVETTAVDTIDGFWLSGAPHEIVVRGPSGDRTETLRLAENTLVWERDGITYRIEAAISRADALRVAATLR